MATENPYPDPEHEYPQPIGGILVGMLPFLVGPLLFLLSKAPFLLAWVKSTPPGDATMNVAASALVWLILLVIIVAAAAGWARGFPAWSLPSWVILLLLTAYLPMVAMPGLVFLGYTFGHEVLGVVGFAPLIAVLVAALLLDHTARPLRALVRGVGRDWTRVTFALYTSVVLFLRISFDEVRGEDSFMVGLDLVLALGALVALTSRDIKRRAWAMLAALVVAWTAGAIYLGIYWNGRQETWMLRPGNGMATFTGQLVAEVEIILAVFLPGILSWFYHRAKRQEKPAD